MAAYLATAQRQGVTVSKGHAQSRDMAAHRAVGVAACARCIACRHAAQAGRSLGWIGGEELLGAGIELVECQKARGVPSVRGDGLVGKMFAQLGEDHAGLHAQVEHACIVTTKAQVGACAREVHNVSAAGHGATGKTGAAALHSDGRACVTRSESRPRTWGTRWSVPIRRCAIRRAGILRIPRQAV